MCSNCKLGFMLGPQSYAFFNFQKSVIRGGMEWVDGSEVPLKYVFRPNMQRNFFLEKRS
jgi:hypothetical protein